MPLLLIYSVKESATAYFSCLCMSTRSCSMTVVFVFFNLVCIHFMHLYLNPQDTGGDSSL